METFQIYPWIILFGHLYVDLECQRTVTPSSDSTTTQDKGIQKGERKLYRKLLHQYDKELRPVIHAEDAVHVTVSITLANVIDIDEKHQSLTTLLWMRTEWNDPFLSWNQTEFPATTYTVIQADKIWCPDLMVYNVLGNTKQVAGEFLGKSEGAEVLPSGKVLHWTPLLLRSCCPMKMDLFPFDLQTCSIVLSPWIYDNAQLILDPAPDVANVGNFDWDMSRKWILEKFEGHKSSAHENYNNRTYDQIKFKISLRRKSTFYVLNLLLPCYLLSIIACLCYVIPPQGTDRINLLLTTFLSIVVFVLVVLEIVPEESDTLPLFSKFLLGVMLMNMFQIFYCTAVCVLHSMDEIRFGPPKCLAIWAKCMRSCKVSSHCCNKSRRVRSKQVNMNEVILHDKGENETDHEFKMLKENSETAISSISDNPTENPNDTLRQNVREWRIVFRIFDVLLFVITFLGITGYFVGSVLSNR